MVACLCSYASSFYFYTQLYSQPSHHSHCELTAYRSWLGLMFAPSTLSIVMFVKITPAKQYKCFIITRQLRVMLMLPLCFVHQLKERRIVLRRKLHSFAYRPCTHRRTFISAIICCKPQWQVNLLKGTVMTITDVHCECFFFFFFSENVKIKCHLDSNCVSANINQTIIKVSGFGESCVSCGRCVITV